MAELSIFEQNYREVAEKHVIVTRHMRSPVNNDGHVVNGEIVAVKRDLCNKVN